MKNKKYEKLGEKLIELIKTNDKSLDFTDIEVKDEPVKRDNDRELANRQNSSRIIDENKIISDNIILRFFKLDDEKFFACLQKINEWGFDVAMKEFILWYYLKVIKDNKLRNYVLFNLSSLLTTIKNSIEEKLLKEMHLFNFTTTDDKKAIDLVKNQIKGVDTVLYNIKAENFDEFEPAADTLKQQLSPEKKITARMAILNRLRYENPKLLE